MKLLNVFSYLLVIFVILFFFVMSLDAFIEENTFFDNLLAYLINSAFGILLIVLLFLLKKRHQIFGVILIILSVFLFFFFDLHVEITKKMLVIFLVILPLVLAGVLKIVFFIAVKK